MFLCVFGLSYKNGEFILKLCKIVLKAKHYKPLKDKQILKRVSNDVFQHFKPFNFADSQNT
jgi:hypothetical protein